jgi:hypothetical protein
MKDPLPPAGSFADILEAIDALPDEDQEVLIGIVKRRLNETARERIIRDVQQSRREYEAGLAKTGTVDELMKELLSEDEHLDSPVEKSCDTPVVIDHSGVVPPCPP